MDPEPLHQFIDWHESMTPEEKEASLEYWASVSPERKFEIARQMVVEVELAKGRKLEDLKLRKDIEVLKRRDKKQAPSS